MFSEVLMLAVLDNEELGSLSDPGQWDYSMLMAIECYRIRDGAWTIPCAVVTTRTRVELVRTKGNYPSSTLVGPLS